ncbi:MAG TPA: MFS transporter, partial [Myxococcales bacterium]|nr:MFS transporter [Myxococcales bacterium]
ADRFFGRYRIILWVSFLYLAGHATLAAWEGSWGLLAGCALIALGAGGIKPCVSAFVGDQFNKQQEHLLERAYGWFYFAINAGSIGGQLLIPKLLGSKPGVPPDAMGPAWAFGVPGLAMAVALLIYIAGRRLYVKAPATGPNPNSFMSVLFGSGFDLQAAEKKFPPDAVNGVRATLRVALVFLPCIGFWSLFYQYGSSWVLQAEKMDLVTGPVKFESSQLSFLNGLFVLLLIPVMNQVYAALERRGRKVTPLRKMATGMFITPLSFVAAALVQVWIESGATPHVLWQIPQYFFLSVGEVLVSVTALEFAYTQAPPSMKSTIMSLWFVVIGSGSLLTGVVASANRFTGASFYWFFTGLQVVAAVIFTLVAVWYRPALAETSVRAEPPARSAA